ncbi:MAG: TAXI family TRAP transporter solute-binding subunit [Deltaproteobacteria bacterium]|jgi:TRAP transporter TAXI family solute receptor|nr:TAXI family TRAP transporter solute-binding subunit [Deltaproteobacteria bacterium]
MKRIPLPTAFPLLALVLFLVFPSAADARDSGQTYVNIGTGGVTGVYYPVGAAICRLVEKGRKAGENSIRCTVESTGASVDNVNALRDGSLDLGIIQSDVQYYAYNGVERFEEAGPNPDLRVLFSLQSESFTLVAKEDAGILKFEDLPGKRVNLGDPGSGSRNTLELLMKEYGWTPETYSLAAELKPAEMAGALCADKIDAFVYVVGHPNASVQEAANDCSARLVPVTGPEVDALVRKYPFYPVSIIPGGMYKGSSTDVTTFGPKATLMAAAKFPEDIAYDITKAVFSNFDEFKSLHLALADLVPAGLLEGNSVPFHPGALKYFKEVGLVKEEPEPVAEGPDPGKEGTGPVK